MEGNGEKSFVVDASFVMAFLFADEYQRAADDVFKRYYDDHVTLASVVLLPFEVGNALRMAIVRSRIDEEKGYELINRFLDLTIPLSDIDYQDVFIYAQHQNLTFYDAAYAVLARSMGVPLLTFDEQLKKLGRV